MSRSVASIIAAIGVMKTGSTTLLNSLLRLRGGRRGRSAARALRSLYANFLPCEMFEQLHPHLVEHLGSNCLLKSDPRLRWDHDDLEHLRLVG